MASKLFYKYLDKLGIEINGDNSIDIAIKDPDRMKKMSGDLSLAVGEAYMDGAWESNQLDETFHHVLKHINSEAAASFKTKAAFFAMHWLSNLQSVRRSKQVAEEHYNLGQDLYIKMLGPTMAYTCAYWKDANNLEEAQNAKYDLVCRKLQLKPGERLLDMGCGFGGLSKYAAEHYGVEAVGVNISTDQLDFARKQVGNLPVTYFESDYRHTHNYNPNNKPFDKVASVGLCEHIGMKNLKNYIHTIRNQVKDDGLALVHTIGKNMTTPYTDPWIRKYIFPHGSLPSLVSLTKACEGQFTIEDIQNFGPDYDTTLMAWYDNFDANWDSLKDQYDERFYLMFSYYLRSCAGGFRARSMQLWQLLLSPNGTTEVSSYVR